MGESVLFLNEQGIHIGAQRNFLAAVPGSKRPDNAGFAQTPVNVQAKLRQLTGNKFRCLRFLKSGFRKPVQMLTPLAHLSVQLLDIVCYRHKSSHEFNDNRYATCKF
jgi:hypothetical protein